MASEDISPSKNLAENTVPHIDPLQLTNGTAVLVYYEFNGTSLANRFSYIPIEKLRDRIQVIKDIFGNDKWRQHVLLLNQTPETLVRKAAAFDEMIPDNTWKELPGLLHISTALARNNINFLNEVLEGDWKKSPRVLSTITRRTKELEDRTATLDAVCGGKHWRKDSDLISYERDTIEQRASHATALFGNHKWTRRPRLLMISEDELAQRAMNLSQEIHDRWRKIPELLELPMDTINTKIHQMDELFGSYEWRKSPKLLLSSTETLQSYAAAHTVTYGSEHWMTLPILGSITPRTFDSSFRALRTMGIIFNNSTPPSTLQLLGTTLDTKRRKATFIRLNLLDHTQVHIITDKVTQGTIYQRRRRMNDDERVIEQNEIEEFKQVLQRKPHVLR